MAISYKKSSDEKPTGLPLSTDLFSSLRKDILQGKLARGQKLTEHQICEEYMVSRTPVREAFKQLELVGLIENIPNRGAFVVGLSPQDLDDLYEMRKSYEVLAVKWAVERITKSEFEKLEEAFEFMEFYTQKKDIEKMLNINLSFHEMIYNASKNRMLANILSMFQIYIKQSKSTKSYAEDYLDVVLAEHRKIFQAFIDKDAEAAVSATSTHLDHARLRAYK